MKKNKLIPVIESAKTGSGKKSGVHTRIDPSRIHTRTVNAPDQSKGSLSMQLIATKGKNPHTQYYYVDPNKKLDKIKKHREGALASCERAFGKPVSEFNPAQLEILSREANKSVINSLVSDRLEFIKSPMTKAGLPAFKPYFEKTIQLAEEGSAVTMYSPTSRSRGELKGDHTKGFYNKEDLNKDDSKDRTINVYKHTDTEGNTFEETIWEDHKRGKAGGYPEKEIERNGHLLLELAERLKSPKPDAIVIPPITGVDDDGNTLPPDKIKDKVDRSLNHRVSKYLSDNIHFPKDEGGKSIPFSEVLSRASKGIDTPSDKIVYDPLALGTKDFQAKKLAGRDKDEDGNSEMQQSSIYRSRETLKRFRSKFELDTGDPELHELAKEELKAKFPGVKHVWLIDDNIDKGGTLFALSKIFEEIGISSTAMAILDMKGTQHPERESKEAIKAKEEQGKLQFKKRQEGAA